MKAGTFTILALLEKGALHALDYYRSIGGDVMDRDGDTAQVVLTIIRFARAIAEDEAREAKK